MRFTKGTARAASVLSALALGGGAAIGLAGSSGADTSQPLWNCRASPAYVEQRLLPLDPLERIEPAVANGNPSFDMPDKAQCADDEALLPHIALPEGPSAIKIDADAVYGRTKIDPDIGKANSQAVDAEAGIAKAKVALGQLAPLILSLDAVNSEAHAKCVNGQPQFSGSSKVLGARIGDIVIPDVLADFDELDLSPLAKITFNEQTKIGTPGDPSEGLVQRAVHIEVLKTPVTPAVNVVLGESKVTRRDASCAPTPPTPTVTTPGPTVTTPGPTVTVPGPTVPGPPGPTVTTPGPTVTTPGQTVTTPGQTVTVPGQPGPGNDGGDRPSGAKPVDLGAVRGPESASPCKRRKFGTQIALLGTNGPDRITGTNRSDRIFARRGNDRASSGRGNDCIDGGTGADRISGDQGTDYLLGGSSGDRVDGGQGADRIYGDSGNDVLVGGSGNDRIYGGAGRDFINTGFGRDRVWSGSGNDVINAATAGNRQIIDCGAGRDTVRMQRYDRARNCERVIIAG